MNQLQKDIIGFVESELKEVTKPNSSSDKYKFKNLSSLTKLLFELLDLHVDDPDLQRVGDNFYRHANKVVRFEEDELSNAIEGLATNLEPFLKLIAYLKWGELPIWLPDGYSLGIKNTSFHKLCLGETSMSYKAPEDVTPTKFPESLFSYHGFKRIAIDFVRRELRNAIHNARGYSRLEKVSYSHLVLASYLLVVEDNRHFLRSFFLPEYKYLKRIIADKRVADLDRVYVEILGQEGFADIDVQGSEQISEYVLLRDVESFSADTFETVEPKEIAIYDKAVESPEQESLSNQIDESTSESQEERSIRVDSIMTIAKDTDHFYLIGHPGSGKSTTLLKILHNQANSILSGNSSLKIPVYLVANEYSSTNSFSKLLSRQLGEDLAGKLLESGRLQILVDGINEINPKYKREALTELESWFNYYSGNSIIISERKVGFERSIDVPIFELTNLTDNQIQEFLINYSQVYGSTLWKQIKSNDVMLALAHNPLMLKMILSVSDKGKIPSNRGLLYKLFLNSIFKREKSKTDQTRLETKVDVLAYVAFRMRLEGNVSESVSKFKRLISQALQSLQSKIALNQLYSELRDNLIIVESSSESVSFFHETYQEYFTAVRVKTEFESFGELNIPLTDSKWFEIILMCSELITDKARSFSFFEYLLNGKQSNVVRKRITDFDEGDFGEDMLIAFKIANGIRVIRPEIYKSAESYLHNYMVLWKYRRLKDGREIIPFSRLVASIASLNSSKLIYKFFSSLDWLALLFHSKDDHKLSALQMEEEQGGLRQQVKLIGSLFAEHAPDFSTTYNILRSSADENFFSKSIFWSLIGIKDTFLARATNNQLSRYLDSYDDRKVFLAILAQDIEVVALYDFENEDIDSNVEVLKVLMRHHIGSLRTHNILIRLLPYEGYSKKFVDSIVNRMYSHNQYEVFYKFLESLYEEGKNRIVQHIPKLQSLPYSILPDEWKAIFIEPDIGSVNYNGKKPYGLKLSSEDAIKFPIGSTALLNESNEITVVKHREIFENGNASVVLFNEDVQLKPERSGVITVASELKQFEFQYRDRRHTNSGNWQFFTDFEECFPVEIQELLEEECEIDVNETSHWFLKNIMREMVPTDWCWLDFSLKDCALIWNQLNVPDSGSLRKLRSEVLSQPKYMYHPDLVVSNHKTLGFLKRNIENTTCVQFIKDLGLTSFFHELIEDVEYAVAVTVSSKGLSYFVINSNEYAYSIHHNSENSKIVEGDLLVRDNLNRLTSIRLREDMLDKIGFAAGRIVMVDPQKRLGFIQEEETTNSYFFLFSWCDFLPKIQTSVRFIKSYDQFGKHKNKPTAIKVLKCG